ncbi:MAG TPA: hypothetical protein VLE74_03305, partial [Candidatus Saccharimonadales bacterium]|nr:hypothetical protein [Candidatus Saccharimonadales bacterium]
MAQTPFGEIADAAHAQAFNEPIERRGEFKVAADYSTYPPEPAYLVGTCVTFIKDDGSLSTKMAVAETDLTHPPRSIDTVVDHFLEDYEERV